MVKTAYQCRRRKRGGSVPGSGRFPGGGNGNPPVILPGKSHGWRSLVGFMGSQELDMTEATEHTARMHVVAAGLSPEQLLLTA